MNSRDGWATRPTSARIEFSYHGKTPAVFRRHISISLHDSIYLPLVQLTASIAPFYLEESGEFRSRRAFIATSAANPSSGSHNLCATSTSSNEDDSHRIFRGNSSNVEAELKAHRKARLNVKIQDLEWEVIRSVSREMPPFGWILYRGGRESNVFLRFLSELRREIFVASGFTGFKVSRAIFSKRGGTRK